jgi:hypothetical protein
MSENDTHDPDAPPVEYLTITSTYTREDWLTFQRACALRVQRDPRSRRSFLILAISFIAGLVIAWVDQASGGHLHIPSAAGGGLLVGIVIVLVLRNARRKYTPEAGGTFLCEHTLRFAADGIHASRPGSFAHTAWSQVQEVTAMTEYVYLWLDRLHGYLVPARDLPAGMTVASFRELIDAFMRAAVASAPGTTDASVPPSLVVSAPTLAARVESRDEARWSRAIPALLTLRTSAKMPASATPGCIAVLACISLVLWAVLQLLSGGADDEFYPYYGVPALAWYVLGLLTLAFLLTARALPAPGMRRTAVLVLAVTPLAMLANFAVSIVPAGADALIAAVAIGYLLLYFARGLRALTGYWQSTAVAAALAFALVFGLATSKLYIDTSVWLAADDADDSTRYDPSDSEAEAVQFSQSARIDRAVAALAPVSGGGSAAYFVGFAGVGEQRVFAEEIELASSVIDARYHTAPRSLYLVNDQRSFTAQPLASPTALRYALRKIAGRMQVDRDILFLALSSHGDRGSLSVSNNVFALHDLTASELASALRDSGIEWRVIVISACYAGSFIEPLRTPRTIVIAASAADRTSFGCADDRDLTYFGEAFYRDALPQAHSLREAFDAAVRAIDERERAEHVDASKPQAYFGAEIERHLASF